MDNCLVFPQPNISKTEFAVIVAFVIICSGFYILHFSILMNRAFNVMPIINARYVKNNLEMTKQKLFYNSERNIAFDQ